MFHKFLNESEQELVVNAEKNKKTFRIISQNPTFLFGEITFFVHQLVQF